MGSFESLTDPAILFFCLGVFMGLVGSNLEVPAPIARFLSLYLLVSLGFKGGRSLAESGVDSMTLRVLGLAILMALLVPSLAYPVLSRIRRLPRLDAAAIAATYGSVSAVTFITATQFLRDRDVEVGGYMTVALVIMESPAIVMAVLLASWVRHREQQVGAGEAPMVSANALGPGKVIVDEPSEEAEAAAHAQTQGISVRAVLHEALTDGSQLLLIGSLVVGALAGAKGGRAMAPFTEGLFKGLLALFLLEMGLLVSRQLRQTRGLEPQLVAFALVAPPVNATIATLIGAAAGLSTGDLTLLAVLSASGSYIVVPAVLRFAIPEAQPGRYFTMALAITFPLNVLVGIPVYHALAKAFT